MEKTIIEENGQMYELIQVGENIIKQMVCENNEGINSETQNQISEIQNRISLEVLDNKIDDIILLILAQQGVVKL